MPDFTVTLPLGPVGEDDADQLLDAFPGGGPVVAGELANATLTVIAQATDAAAAAAAVTRQAEEVLGRPAAGPAEAEPA
jgi:hypothetical protein